MQIEVAIGIDAAPERVWPIMADVERWPEWTASMVSVERLEDGPLVLGSTVRVKQPRLLAAVWRVTSIEPGVGFVWETQTMGAHVIGGHRIAPDGNGGSRAMLTIRMTGPLVPLFGLLTSRVTRRYMNMEAAGLKSRAEGALEPQISRMGTDS